jgi:hypothetical protein
MKLSPADKAMLITFTGASLLVLVFFFLGVKPFQNPNPEEEFIEIPVVQEFEEELEEEEKTIASNKVSSHRAYNASELRKESKELFEEEDAVRKAIEEQRLKSVQDLTTENENALSESRKKQEQALKDHKEAVRKQIEERELERELKNAAAKRESTVSYNLLGRDAIYIPNPVYTCDARGKIVLNITVNAKGAITQMAYNKKASTSLNGCLIDQALAYANDAIFNSSSKGTQLGSITFNFQN